MWLVTFCYGYGFVQFTLVLNSFGAITVKRWRGIDKKLMKSRWISINKLQKFVKNSKTLLQCHSMRIKYFVSLLCFAVLNTDWRNFVLKTKRLTLISAFWQIYKQRPSSTWWPFDCSLINYCPSLNLLWKEFITSKLRAIQLIRLSEGYSQTNIYKKWVNICRVVTCRRH